MRTRIVASMAGVLVGLALSWLVVTVAQTSDSPRDTPVVWGPPQPTPAAQSTVFGVVALMWSAGCSDPQRIAVDPGRSEMGTCTTEGGHEVAVAVFAPGAQAAWVKSITSHGSIVVEGDRWAVAGLDAAGPAEFAAAVPN